MQNAMYTQLYSKRRCRCAAGDGHAHALIAAANGQHAFAFCRLCRLGRLGRRYRLCRFGRLGRLRRLGRLCRFGRLGRLGRPCRRWGCVAKRKQPQFGLLRFN